MEQKLSTSLDKNIEAYQTLFKDCFDVKGKRLKLGKENQIEVFVGFIEASIENVLFSKSILGQLFNSIWDLPEQEKYAYLRDNGLGIVDMQEVKTIKDVESGVLSGDAVLFVEGYDKALRITTKGYPNRGVPKAENETVLRGSQEGFGEAIKLNTMLVRKRIKDARLKAKRAVAGVRSRTEMIIMYMDGVARTELVAEVEKRLSEFEIDGILDSGMIEQLTEQKWYSPFPVYQSTERPDKVAEAVLEGRIAVFIDNSPMVLILPTTLNSFFQTADDYYNRWEVVSMVRWIRYIGAFLSMALPGLYLGITNFQPEILPTSLALSFSAAREGIPFSAVSEIILMELAFELLREAGIRLPGNMGRTIGIVGGLIIGQAAVEANVVSPIVVILVALTALASFVVPGESFASAFRLLKFGLILISAWLGIYGFLLGCLFIILHLANLRSFGIPYLMPFVGADLNGYDDEKDSMIRLPLRMLKRRPIYARQSNRVRLREKKK